MLSACTLLGSKNKKYDPEIVFSAKDKTGSYQIYTMNEDGSNVTKLTHWEAGATQPSWSPDGKTILFSSFRNGTSIGPGMWVMNADGSNKHPLHEYQLGEHTAALEGNNARWSPDGKKSGF
jgi:TolB protein